MLKNSNQFTEAIKSDAREMKARVTINNIVYGDELINNIEFSSSALSGEQLAIGSTHENTVSIEFSEVIQTIAPLDRVFVEIGVKRQEFSAEEKKVLNNGVGRMRVGSRLNMWNSTEEVEYSLMGEFYISEHVDINYNDQITTIECKDKMIFLEDEYVSALEYPADIRQVILEIANLGGVEIDHLNIEELDGLMVERIEGHTYRQALGFLAQLLVGYVYFNRKGLLQIRRLSDAEYDITPDDYASKGLTKNGIRYRVRGITCNVPDDEEPQELFVGSKMGPQLTIENPLMTQELLQGIYDELQTVDYYPFDLEWQGNPALETGDLMTVYDLEGNEMKVPNLNYKLTYNGGLSATSSADTKSQTDIVASGRKTLQQQIHATQTKIKDTATNLENAFKDAQDKITGNQGGYIIQRFDEDGKPYEFLIMDTEDINTATNVIRLNQQGMGFSQTGYNGPFGVAITIDGQIVADYITAGTLSAELIQAGFNGIAFGTSITEEGIKQVDSSGEYAIIQSGGMRFYTAQDALNGSIESSYQTLSDGVETGVGIFIQPGKKFVLVRNNPDGVANKTIFELPPNDDELKMHTRLNLNAKSIYDAQSIMTRNDINESVFYTWGSGEAYLGGGTGVRLGYRVGSTNYTLLHLSLDNIAKLFSDLDLQGWKLFGVGEFTSSGKMDVSNEMSANRFNIKGTNQYLLNNSNGGGAYIDSQKVALGIGALSGWANKLEVTSAGTKLFDSLDANGQNIEKVNLLYLGAGSTTSSLFNSESGVLIAGGSNGVSFGARQSNGSVTNLFRIHAEGAHISYRDINMAGNNITNTSDIRLKKNIQDAANDPLSDIMKMRFATFEWDKDNPFNADKPDGVQFGQIAQYAPAIMQMQNGEKDHYLSISINKQVDLTSMATQRLNEERIKHAEEIESLKIELEKLREKIEV